MRWNIHSLITALALVYGSGLGLPAGLRAQDADAPAGFRQLFNGKDLNGWTVLNCEKADWSVHDGILTTVGVPMGWLMTEEEFDDFELRLEYRPYRRTNSGIALRSPLKMDPAFTGMEVQILDDANYPDLRGDQYSLAIYDVVGPRPQAEQKIGAWNKLTIVARGRQITISLNGTQVLDAKLDDYQGKSVKHPGLVRTSGRIGLQTHTNRADFRNIFVKPLGAEREALPKVPTQPFLVFDAGGHIGLIKGIVFTPNGDRIISISGDKTIRIWNIATKRSERVLRPPIGEGYVGNLAGLAVAPDGQVLAVSGFFPQGGQKSGIHAILLINLSSGRVERVLRGHTNVISCLVFSADGKLLASGAADRTIRVWNPVTGESEGVLEGNKAAITSLCFSPDGKRLVVGSADGVARIWSLSTGQPETDLFGHAGSVRVTWSPDSNTVVTGDVNRNFKVWTATGSLVKSFRKPDAVLAPANAISPDGRFLLALSGRSGKLLDLETGERRAEFSKHENTALCGAISPDGRLVATGGLGAEIALWGAATGELVALFASQSKPMHAAAWSQDGQTVAWGNIIAGENLNGNLRPLARTFNLSTLEFDKAPDSSFLRERLQDDSIQVSVLENFSLRPRVIIKSGADTLTEFRAAGQVYCCTLLSGNRLVVGGHYLVLYDSRTGKKLRQFTQGSDDLSPSADDRYLLSTFENQLNVWRLDRNVPLLSLFVAGEEWVCWTPEGYYAASPGGEQLMGWQVNNGLDQLASFYPASQFRKLLYRPDVIQGLLAAGSLEKALAQASPARGRQSRGTDVAQSLPPRVRLQAPARSGEQVPAGKLEVRAEAQAVGGRPITAMRLLVDGRPNGDDGAFVDSPDGDRVGSWTVELPAGRHRLAVRADNALSNAISDEVEVVIGGEVKNRLQSAGNLYVVAIGINAYPGTLKLDCAAPDARAIDEVFRKHSRKLFRQVETRLLIDSEATRDNIRAALSWLKQRAKPGDVAVLFYAGHGDSKRADKFFLLPVDVDVNNLPSTGIAGDELKERLQLPCSTVVFLDACYSGSFDARKKKKRGLPDAADDAVRELVYDEGLVVFCGAAKEQEAAEENGHGYFTTALVEALSGKAQPDEDGLIDIDALQLYATRKVRKLSGREQEMTISRPSTVRSFPLTRPGAD
jgi:WD40 repeat protein